MVGDKPFKTLCVGVSDARVHNNVGHNIVLLTSHSLRVDMLAKRRSLQSLVGYFQIKWVSD